MENYFGVIQKIIKYNGFYYVFVCTPNDSGLKETIVVEQFNEKGKRMKKFPFSFSDFKIDKSNNLVSINSYFSKLQYFDSENVLINEIELNIDELPNKFVIDEKNRICLLFSSWLLFLC